jgi:hypothetical protein
MRKLILIGIALCAAGALSRPRPDDDDDDEIVPGFLAALAIEMGVFLLRRHQGKLLNMHEKV